MRPAGCALVLAIATLAGCGDPGARPIERRHLPPELRVQEAQHAYEGDVLKLPRAELTVDPSHASSKAGGKLLALITRIRESMRDTKYQARTQVRAADGYYAWDCSGMTTWLLKKSAPRALRAVNSVRPVARDYYRTIARAPVDRPRKGWQRVAHVRDARPGDLFAFLRSPLSVSKITGHVGVLVGTPVAVPYMENAWAVRILDSTRAPHQDDTRIDDPEGGFGFGTMLFVTDDTGEVQGYGWFGTESWGIAPTHVVFGRVAG